MVYACASVCVRGGAGSMATPSSSGHGCVSRPITNGDWGAVLPSREGAVLPSRGCRTADGEQSCRAEGAAQQMCHVSHQRRFLHPAWDEVLPSKECHPADEHLYFSRNRCLSKKGNDRQPLNQISYRHNLRCAGISWPVVGTESPAEPF